VDVSASFVLFMISASFTPGPNNIMIMTSGLNHGVKASFAHLMGITLGVPTMFLVVGFALSYLFQQNSWLHTVIQVVGVIYLFYLAWLIAVSMPASLDNDEEARRTQTKPLSFIQAALFQWVNPKAWMLGTGAIATFSTVGADTDTQILTMAFAFFLVAFPSAGTWLVFGSQLKRLLSNANHLLMFNRVMALLLVVSVSDVIVSLTKQFLAWL